MTKSHGLDLHALANAPMSETRAALAPFLKPHPEACPFCGDRTPLTHDCILETGEPGRCCPSCWYLGEEAAEPASFEGHGE